MFLYIITVTFQFLIYYYYNRQYYCVYQCDDLFLYDVRVLQSNYIPTFSVYYYSVQNSGVSRNAETSFTFFAELLCPLLYTQRYNKEGFDLTERKSDQFRYTCSSSSSSSRQSGAGKSALNEVSAFPLYRVPLFTVSVVNLMCTRRSICHYYTVCLS